MLGLRESDGLLPSHGPRQTPRCKLGRITAICRPSKSPGLDRVAFRGCGRYIRGNLPAVRIASLTHYFPPETNAPAARVHELSRALVRLGHEVHVVTGQPNHPRGVIFPGYRAAAYTREDRDGIAVHRVPTLPAANRGLVRRGLGFAAVPVGQVAWGLAKLPTVDVVIATSPQMFTGAAGLALARARRVPFILEIRDLWPESIVSLGALPADHWLISGLTRLEKFLYHQADAIVSVTDSFVDHFTRCGVPRERVFVLKNGADLAHFDPACAPAPLRSRLGLSDDAVIVLFCGTIGLSHDVGIFARAAAYSPAHPRFGPHYVIVGDGADRDRVAAEIASLGVADRVHLLPAVPRDEVPGLLAAADITAVVLRDSPTFAGVLPSKIFEAMAMAKPVVLGVRGEALALLTAAKAGVAFSPGDVAGLVAAVDGLIAAGPQARRTLGEAGRRYVLAHHDRDRQALDLAAFLERVRAR